MQGNALNKWQYVHAALVIMLALMLASCGGKGHHDRPDPPPPASTGSMVLAITGLPAGVDGALGISGPGGYAQTVRQGQTLAGLVPGTYTISASEVLNGSIRLLPTPASQQVSVAAGASASAGVTYAAAPPLALALQAVAGGLVAPVFLTAPPGDSRLFIVERAGRVRIVENNVVLATPLLDMRSRVSSAGEGGLLSIAFDPGFAGNGHVYLYYTDLGGNIVIERQTAPAGNRAQVDPLSALPIISLAHPTYSNHYGGMLAFGPDGMLYAGTGDGGGAGDPSGNAQNTNVLLGKLLRLDVAAATALQPYAIPPDNPFAGQAGRRGEIWAFGLRNPWRFAFDRGRLYVADVGQDRLEEIDIAAAGAAGNNYGWNIAEGSACYPAPGCSLAGLVAPAFEYEHGSNNVNGCSITGGYVYRGSALPELAGQYLYSDFCGGWLKGLLYRDGATAISTDLGLARPGNVLSFGQDGLNELYLMTSAGAVYRIVRAP